MDTQLRHIPGTQQTTCSDMHISHRSNAAAHTPIVCGTPICAVLLWLVVFCRSLPSAFLRLPDFFPYVFPQADVNPCTFLSVVARSIYHRPDNNSNSAQSMITSSFLLHHNPAVRQQQQWAHVARMDDRTAAIKVDLSEISIDHLTTPPPHHHISPLTSSAYCCV